MKKSIIIILAVVAVGAAAYFIYRKYYSASESSESEEEKEEVDDDTDDDENDGGDAKGTTTTKSPSAKIQAVATPLKKKPGAYYDKYGFIYDKDGHICIEEKYGETFIQNTGEFIKNAYSNLSMWQALYFDCGTIAEQLYDDCIDVNKKKSYKDLVDTAVEEIKSSLGDGVKLGTNNQRVQDFLLQNMPIYGKSDVKWWQYCIPLFLGDIATFSVTISAALAKNYGTSQNKYTDEILQSPFAMFINANQYELNTYYAPMPESELYHTDFRNIIEMKRIQTIGKDNKGNR